MSTATAKVVSAPNPDLKDFDPTQPTTFVAMIVENDRNRGSLTITAETEAQDATVSFKINSMRYDEKATGDIKFVPDKDKAAEAEAICQEAFGLSFEEVSELSITDAKKFTAYTDGTNGFFKPFSPFIRFDKMTELSSAERKLIGRGEYTLEPLRVAESENFYRFEFGTIVNVGDKSYTLRISQLAIESDDLDDEDVELSTKYENRTVKGLRDALRDDKLDEDSRAMIQRNIDRTAAITRAERVEELNSALGVDIEDMIKNEKALVFNDLDVRSIKTGNGETYFLVGTVEMEDVE